MSDASGQAQKLCPQEPVGDGFILQGERGLEKPASSFLGVAAPPWYPVRGVFTSAKAGPQTLALGLTLNADLIPSPVQGPEANLKAPLMKKACLALMVFLSHLFP